MKKEIAFLCVVLTLWGCTSKKENEIMLFNNTTFKLMEGETVTSIDAKIKGHYYSYVSTNTTIQIPLFKSITSENYNIYLGLPIHTTVKKLADFKLKEVDSPSFFDSDTTSYFYIRHQNGDDYVSEYCQTMGGNTIYVLAVVNALSVSDSLFNLEALSNRLN